MDFKKKRKISQLKVLQDVAHVQLTAGSLKLWTDSAVTFYLCDLNKSVIPSLAGRRSVQPSGRGKDKASSDS